MKLKIEDEVMKNREHIDAEEALRALISEPMVLPKFLKIFGKENFEILKNLFRREDVLYMEFLYLSGQLEEEEARDYLIVLDDFHQLRRDIYEKASIIADNLTKQAESALKRAIKMNSNGTWNVDSRTFANLIESTDRCFHSFNNLHNEKALSLIAPRIFEFRNVLYLKLGEILYGALAKYPQSVQSMVINYLSMPDTFSPSNQPFSLGRGMFIKQILEGGERVKFHNVFKEGCKDIADVDDPNSLDLVFEKINFLSYNRKIRSHKLVISDQMMLEFSLDERDDGALMKPNSVCSIDVYIKGIKKLGMGLCRSRGELNSYLFDYPLQKILDDQALYLKFKKLVLDHLYEYLSSKDEDYVRVPSANPKSTISNVKFELRNFAEIKPAAVVDEAVLEKELEQSLIEDFDVSSSKDMPVVEDVEVLGELDGVFDLPNENLLITGLADGSEDFNGEVERSPKRKVRVTLKGLSGNVVKGALIRLLGPPVWVSGSHNVFEGRDGIRFPMPFHGKEPVGTGILIACLKRFGISKREFYEEVRGKLKG